MPFFFSGVNIEVKSFSQTSIKHKLKDREMPWEFSLWWFQKLLIWDFYTKWCKKNKRQKKHPLSGNSVGSYWERSENTLLQITILYSCVEQKTISGKKNMSTFEADWLQNCKTLIIIKQKPKAPSGTGLRKLDRWGLRALLLVWWMNSLNSWSNLLGW